jgi:NitT/TauT family transport system permease protein
MIMRARRFVRGVDEVMAGIVMIGVLGLLLDLLFRLLHWELLPYARQRSRKT